MRVLLLSGLLAVASNLFANSIWQVTSPKQDHQFFLFGTIHVLKPEAYPLADAYEKTLNQCDALWLEVDMAEMSDAQIMQQLQSKMLLPVGDTLKEQLSEADYVKLKQLAELAGVPLALLQGLKPWAVVNQLTLLVFQQQGFTGEGLDGYLYQQAKAQGIPVQGLETLLWQIAMFDTMASEDPTAFLDFSMEDMENFETLIAQMYQSWRSGNYQSLYEQSFVKNSYPEIEQVLLTERNNNWMNLLTESPSGTQCVAVGLLHMAGEHGLIQQFEGLGYKVEQVQ